MTNLSCCVWLIPKGWTIQGWIVAQKISRRKGASAGVGASH
jgi:hypothetical protein